MIPPRTILATTDFSDASASALMFAARLARHGGAALHVLHAEHPLLDAAAGQNGIDLLAETREELERAVRAAPPAAECAPRLHAIAGPAVDVILSVAHAQRADVVVVGSRGMSGTEKLVFGSTTEGVLRRSDVSVFVVPAGWHAPRQNSVDLAGTGPIIAGVDMDPTSIEGARAACGLATMLGTGLEILHVVPDLKVLGRWRRHADSAVQDRLSASRKELEGVVRNLGCTAPIEWQVESGAVAERLASRAARASGRTPLLVLGKKGPGTAGGAPGTIAYRVLSLGNVPLLMYVA
jgi:nucleotide-binding universal stress UspA family protein